MTGASGFLGRNLLDRMLKTDSEMFYILVRSDRAQQSIREKIKWADPERVKYVQGDLSRPYCGLSVKDQNLLSGKIEEVWHLAASTAFDESKRAEIFSTNSIGTDNLLSAVSSFSKLEKLFYISTAYVCGEEGVNVPEEQLSEKRKFRNPYEESKLNAENKVRTSKIPFTIIRPSILMGDSKTGEAEGEDRMVYGYLLGVYFSALSTMQPPRDKNFWKYWEESSDKKNYREISTRFRANANTGKNLVTIDDMVNVCLAIQSAPDNQKKTYNVVNSKDISVGQIVDTMQETLHIQGIRYIPNLPAKDITNGSVAERVAFKKTQPYWPYVHGPEPNWIHENVDSLNVSRVEMNKDMLSFLLNTYVKKYLKPSTQYGSPNN